MIQYENNYKLMQKSPERNIIISPVGDTSCHKTWIKGKNRKFDLMLIYHGTEDNKYREDADYYLQMTDKYKLGKISEAINKLYDVVKQYDAIWLPDDDITTDTRNINRLFKLFHKYDLDLAQPSVLGQVNHGITRPNWRCKLRYVNFVEMMCPLFKTDALLKILDTFKLNSSGWGIDFLWGEILENNELAIIDSVIVIHKGLFSKNEKSKYYDDLAKGKISAYDEYDKIMSQYKISSNFMEKGKIEESFFKAILRSFRNYSQILAKHFFSDLGGFSSFYSSMISL